MAVSLIDSNVVNPSLAHLHAHETFICDLSYSSVQIDVHLNYQGTKRCYYSYIYTYNPAEGDSQNFTWDQPEEKSGMTVACNLINKEVSLLLQGKDLLQFKKIDDILKTFKDRREA